MEIIKIAAYSAFYLNFLYGECKNGSSEEYHQCGCIQLYAFAFDEGMQLPVAARCAGAPPAAAALAGAT
jgi:hypothetical protein